MQNPSPIRSSELARRRNLLAAGLLGIVLVLGGYFVVHAATGSHSAAHKSHKSHPTARKSHAAKPKARRAPRKARGPRRTTKHPISPLRTYASHLVPVLDHSRAAFDQTTGAVEGSADLSSAGDACASSAPRILMLEDRAEGIPHPYAWYTPVAHLHYDLMGIYHLMLGGLNACNTAADNEDYDALQQAVGDVDSADHAMRGMDDRVRSLARR